MPNKEMEERHLAESDRLIAEAEQRIAKQKALIVRFRTNGYDTTLSKQLLATFVELLQNMRTHRELILLALDTIRRENL